MTFEANQSKSMVYTVPKLYSNSYSLYDCVICILYPFSLRRGKILVFSKVTYTACEQALLWWWWAGGGGRTAYAPKFARTPLGNKNAEHVNPLAVLWSLGSSTFNTKKFERIKTNISRMTPMKCHVYFSSTCQSKFQSRIIDLRQATHLGLFAACFGVHLLIINCKV